MEHNQEFYIEISCDPETADDFMRMLDDVKEFIAKKKTKIVTSWINQGLLIDTNVGFSCDYIDGHLIIGDDNAEGNGNLAIHLIQKWLQYEHFDMPVQAIITDVESSNKDYYLILQDKIVCDQGCASQNAPGL